MEHWLPRLPMTTPSKCLPMIAAMLLPSTSLDMLAFRALNWLLDRMAALQDPYVQQGCQCPLPALHDALSGARTMVQLPGFSACNDRCLQKGST